MPVLALAETGVFCGGLVATVGGWWGETLLLLRVLAPKRCLYAGLCCCISLLPVFEVWGEMRQC